MANCLDGLAEGLFERHGVSFFKGSFHGIAKRTNFDVLGGMSYWQDGTPDAPEGANRVDGGRPRRDAGDRAGARPHNRRGVEVACALCQRPLGRLFGSAPSGARWKYDAEPARRILAMRDTPPPEGYANWTGSVLARALGEINVQYFRRSLARTENIRDRMQHETWRLRRSNCD